MCHRLIDSFRVFSSLHIKYSNQNFKDIVIKSVMLSTFSPRHLFFCSIWASFSDLFKIWTIGGSKRKNHGRMTWSKSCIYKMMISKWTNCINKIVKYSAPNLLLTKNELDWRKERLNRNHSHVSAGLSVSVVCYVSNSCSVSMFHCFVFVIVTVVFAFHFFLFSFVILHSVRLFGALRTVAFQRLDRKFM